MHDLDHTKLEVEGGGELFFELQDAAVPGELEYGEGAELQPVEEMELASELLGVSSDQELDLFLGNLFKKAKQAMSSPAGRVLGGLLRNVAKKALPVAGAALGGMIGGPFGAGIGGQLASQAGTMFGLELEGMSPQDQEYEVAKSFVRLARSAAGALGTSPEQAMSDPVGTAKAALISAARTHAPGLLHAVGNAAPGGNQVTSMATAPRQSGRWVRQGNRIILFGI